MKILLWPEFGDPDNGDGGIRRVVEAQLRYLPQMGVEFVKNLEDADLAAVHIEIPNTYLVKRPDLPVVVHNHGLYWGEYSWLAWGLKANERIMESMRQADAVTVPSKWVAQALSRNIAQHIVPVYHGVDVDEWQLRGSSGYIFWNKTRVDPVCDVSAVGTLAEMLPQLRFLTTFSDEKERENVVVVGRQPYEEGKRLLEQAAVYLCTTRETFGIGTLEALACGVPVVGWAWGGQTEIVKQRENGWLSQPGDFEDLAKGIAWAIEKRNSPEFSEKLRSQVAKDFSWQTAMEQYLKVYEDVLARRTRMRPKVSVVVTAYNLAQYLPECLKSVQAQTMPDWECVVVDDASPDECGQIADDFAAQDSRFKVVHNTENQYLAEARNTGMAASAGEYLLPLDADDMLPPGALDAMSTTLDKNRQWHIVYGGVLFLEPDGRQWHSSWPIEFSFTQQIVPPQNGGRPRNLLPYSALMRREVWERTGGYRRRCRTAEDADFWCRVASYGFRPAMAVPADTLIYRNREGSMSRQETYYDWTLWYPWARVPQRVPAGAVTQVQQPIYTYDPPAVTVVIPVGPAHAEVVFDAIDSVDAQTLRRWECIVVDDTGGLLKKERLPAWCRYFSTGKKGGKGVSFSRNLGLKHANAPYFLPLDADDYLQPEALEVLYAAIKEHGGYVYSDWWEDWGEGKLTLWTAKDYEVPNLRKGCLHAVTALYPLSAWKDLKGFDEEINGWEDWDFQLALSNVPVCGIRVESPLWVYRKPTGRRREENQAAFEQSKQDILKKWGFFWEGKDMAGCGGCGRSRSIAPRPVLQALRRPQNGDDFVLLEYTGNKEGAVVYKGAVTKAVYSFGGGAERRKYVYHQDAPTFLARADFREVLAVEDAVPESAEKPSLVVEGPPAREAAVV